MDQKIIINGRTRIVKKIVKDKSTGFKRNCNHNMSKNEAINVRTDRFEDWRKCIKGCGFWKRKIIYFDTTEELKLLFYQQV